MTRPYFLLSALMLLASACGDESGEVANATRDEEPEVPEQAALDTEIDCPDAGDAGSGPDLRETVRWETDELTLEPGKDRYVCFTKPVDSDLVVNGYATEGAPFVHHLMLSKLKTPGPNGFADCDKAFDLAWDPIFAAGTGPGKLDFPKEAGHVLSKGQQLVVQLHLRNADTKPVQGKLAIALRKSTVSQPVPVVSYVFGLPTLALAPQQSSIAIGDCTVPSEVKLIAGFPHMHGLGKSLRFEVGPTQPTLRRGFRRDPFSFHEQTIEPLDLTIPAGSLTRLTCEWNNPSTQVIEYGEGMNDEMCSFIGFALGTGGSCTSHVL